MSSTQRFLKLAESFLVLALLFTSTSNGQVSNVSANLEGIVTDSSGAVIPGAQVTLRRPAIGFTRSVTSDRSGFFRASGLLVGTYEVRVAQPGFAPYSHTGVTLTVGQTVALNIELVPSSQVQHVTVTAQPSAIDRAETSVTTTVGRERIEELPVSTRNALDFVLLAPGVSRSNPSQASNLNTPLAGSGFTFGGLRTRSNSLSIDGLDNNDEFSGGSRTELSPEVVQEFQIINNGLSAEFGGASGGSINVVSRTGTNVTHGDAFIFVQSGAFNARQPLTEETSKPNLTRYRGGISQGGPVVRDRTFYYAAVEQEHIRSQSSSDIDPALAASVNGYLAGNASPSQIATHHLTPGLFPIALAETEASAKINHQIDSHNSLMLRYAFTNNKEASEGFNTGGLTDVSGRGSTFTRDHGLVGSLTSVLTSNSVNDWRFQVARRNVTRRTNDQLGPEIFIAGLIDFGRSYLGNSHHREDHYELSDAFGVTKGSHLFKLGTTANHVQVNAFEPDGFGGLYIFPSLADFLSSQPDTFRQAFGNASTALGVTSWGAFLQDHWTVNKSWVLDLGVRYDFERLPHGFNQDTNNFSPRLGVAYAPSNRLVLRAGTGILFDRYILANLNRVLRESGQRGFEHVSDGQRSASIFKQAAGGPLASPFPEILPSIFQADPRMATSYSQQSNLGIEYLLAPNLTVSGNYLLVRGVKLARTLNSNLVPPTRLPLENAAMLSIAAPSGQQIGRNVFGPGRYDPRYQDIYRIENSASSTYNGLSISLNRRATDVTLAASYTLSKTLDDASDFNEQPQNPFELRDERALSLNDQRHRFILSGLFDLPFGSDAESASSTKSRSTHAAFLDRIFSNIELAPIITISSGRPVNPLVGLDASRNHSYPLSARPLGFGRNTLRTPPQATVDLRVLKSFYFSSHRRLDLVVESFNLLNRTNVSQLNPFFGPAFVPVPRFRQPIETLNARQIEFSIDFEY